MSVETSIKATVDGVSYTGIESIISGGKTIALEAILASSGLNWESGVISKNSINKLPTITHNLGTKNYIFILLATDESGTVTVQAQYSMFLIAYIPVKLFYGSGLNLDLSAYNSTASNPFVISGEETQAPCGFTVGSPAANGNTVYATVLRANECTVGENDFTYIPSTYYSKFKWYAIDVTVSG